MDILRIPLIAVSDAGVDVAAEFPVTAIQPPGAAPLPLEMVNIEGTLTPMGEEYLFRGCLRSEFVQPCDRCLEEARHAFDTDVAWVYEEGPPVHPLDGAVGEVMASGEDLPGFEEAPGVKRYQGTEIDLRLALWEELQFAEPEKYICREGCRGLCPDCGANLNEAPCGCALRRAREERQNSGLSGLADLYPELDPRKSKE